MHNLIWHAPSDACTAGTALRAAVRSSSGSNVCSAKDVTKNLLLLDDQCARIETHCSEKLAWFCVHNDRLLSGDANLKN